MKRITQTDRTHFKKYPYYEWETFKMGMYKTHSEILNMDSLSTKARELLSNQILFLENGLKMINSYKKSCNTFLGNVHVNRIAFIGQATCLYYCGVPEIITKDVFKNLPLNIQNEANQTATKILNEYKRKSRDINKQTEIEWIY